MPAAGPKAEGEARIWAGSRPVRAAGPAARLLSGWDSGFGVVAMFGLAVLVGLVAGLGAQRWAGLDRRPLALRQGPVAQKPVTQKEAVAEGYQTDADYLADHARERVVITRLLAAPVGSQQIWENPETGNRGVIWVARETVRADGGHCRGLVRHTLINNAFHDTEAVTCRANAGDFPSDVTWRPEGSGPSTP